VILEDDGSDTPNLEAAAIFILVDANADPPSGPSKKPWYDIEDECFLEEDLHPVPPLEQKALVSTRTSMSAQDQRHPLRDSPRSLQDQRNLHDNDKITRNISDTTPESKDKVGEGWNADSVAELEREVQQSLDGQEKVPPTSAPGSICRDRPSTEPQHPQIDQEDDQNKLSHSRLEELRRSSLLYSQDQEEPQEQEQPKEVTVELMREEEKNGNNEQREPQGENQECQDGNKELSSDNYPHGSDCNHKTSEQDDEDPRPAKRRKLLLSPTPNNALTPNEPISIDNNQ
jgi:hypothetical protein